MFEEEHTYQKSYQPGGISQQDMLHHMNNRRQNTNPVDGGFSSTNPAGGRIRSTNPVAGEFRSTNPANLGIRNTNQADGRIRSTNPVDGGIRCTSPAKGGFRTTIRMDGRNMNAFLEEQQNFTCHMNEGGKELGQVLTHVKLRYREIQEFRQQLSHKAIDLNQK